MDAKKLTAKTPYVPKGWTLRQAQNHTHVIYVMHILSLDICGYHDTSTSAHIVLVTLSPEPLELRILSPGPAVQLETSCQSSKLVSIECAHLRQREGNWPHQHMCWRNGERVTRMPWRSCWKRSTLTRTVNIVLYINHLG